MVRSQLVVVNKIELKIRVQGAGCRCIKGKQQGQWWESEGGNQHGLGVEPGVPLRKNPWQRSREHCIEDHSGVVAVLMGG